MRAVPLLAVAAALSAAGPASAAAPPRPPMQLPGQAGAAATATWIVGARPTAAARALARRAGARPVLPGAFVVPRAGARELARALERRGLLTYAEPDSARTLRQERAVADDPLSASNRWRDAAVDPTLAPPPVTPDSPLLALVDSKLQAEHPEFAGGNVTTLRDRPVGNLHGTATLAVAAAPQNGVGIVGVWPGMRAVNVSLPATRVSCSDSAGGIAAAVRAGADVINMSYGSSGFCYLEFQALQLATSRGATLVAAAGNEFAQGNPLEFPASLPHVLTVAALTPRDRAAYFSNENAAIDLSAPGVNILTAVPRAFDEDGSRDGYMSLNGTSFAAPIVAAAATWVRAERPDLSADQVAQVIRLSARDLGNKGWEASTGFGALDLRAALATAAPPVDPKEPNEDVPFVSGAAFGRRDSPVWTGGRARTLFATLDHYEDPGDVYRVRIPRGRRMRVEVDPRFGDPDLEVYSGRARHVATRRHRIVRSRRGARRTERVSVINRGARTATAYVRVFTSGRGSGLDAAYDLTIR